MCHMDHTKIKGWANVLSKGKQLLLPLIHPPCNWSVRGNVVIQWHIKCMICWRMHRQSIFCFLHYVIFSIVVLCQCYCFFLFLWSITPIKTLFALKKIDELCIHILFPLFFFTFIKDIRNVTHTIKRREIKGKIADYLHTKKHIEDKSSLFIGYRNDGRTHFIFFFDDWLKYIRSCLSILSGSFQKLWFYLKKYVI